MAHTGLMPCVASPPANVTAWPSAMPTSKNRSGHRFWKIAVPVPDGIAAVIATRSGCSSASAVSASPNTWVHVGGPLAFFRGSPVIGSYAARPCHFSRFDSAKPKPFPFSVSTCTTRGPVMDAHRSPGCRTACRGRGRRSGRSTGSRVPRTACPGDQRFLTLSSTFLAKSTTPWPNTPPSAKVMCFTFSRSRLVRGSATMAPSVLLIAPTLGEMDMPLSLTIEHDVAVGVTGVVHPLVGEAAGEGAVAHHRDDLVLLAPSGRAPWPCRARPTSPCRRARRRTGRARSRCA